MSENDFKADGMPDDFLVPPTQKLAEDPEVTAAFAELAAAEKAERTGGKYRFSPKQIAATMVVVAIAPFAALLAFKYIG